MTRYKLKLSGGYNVDMRFREGGCGAGDIGEARRSDWIRCGRGRPGSEVCGRAHPGGASWGQAGEQGRHLDEQVTASQAGLCSGKQSVTGAREAGTEKGTAWEATMHEYSKRI